jgi:hypothetical protein
VKIIEEAETLADNEWASIQEVLSESFGKDLAVAASRGKLTLRSQETAAETPLQIVPDNTGQQPVEQEVHNQENRESAKPLDIYPPSQAVMEGN